MLRRYAVPTRSRRPRLIQVRTYAVGRDPETSQIWALAFDGPTLTAAYGPLDEVPSAAQLSSLDHRDAWGVDDVPHLATRLPVLERLA